MIDTSNNILDEQLIELLNVFEPGDTVISLFDKCTLCQDYTDVARLVHYGVKEGALVKTENGYTYKHLQHKTLIATPPVEDSPILPEKIVTKQKTKQKPVRKTPLKVGNLCPTTQIGRVALALFAHKGKFLTEHDIRISLGSDAAFFGTLNTLCNRKYAYRRHTKTGVTFKWSETFDYPFENQSPSDFSLILVQV